jgi:dihydropyrimidinase
LRYDTIVRNGDVVLPERPHPDALDLGIAGGKVAALLGRGEGRALEQEWDASGCVVMPGAVDSHVHVNWPFLHSRTRDDYATASRAAAAGGTTTILDYAVEGREDPVAAVLARRREAAGASVVDFGLHCVVSEASAGVLQGLADVVALGVTSFKMYTTYRRRGLAVGSETMASIARRTAELGAVLIVHAEDAEIADAGTAEMQRLGHGAARFMPDAKPPRAEAVAVASAAEAVGRAGGRLAILHLSSAAGLQAAQEARARWGQPMALETCPQYLLLDRGRLEGEDGQRFLCSPPLREPDDAARLWRAVADGVIDWVGSDHCLFLKAQKDEYRHAFWECPHGLPGVETRVAVTMAAALDRGIGLPRLAEIVSTAAARWYGLYPRKGTLVPGSDADLAVWDLGRRAVVRSRDLHMGCDWTPYEGLEALAAPRLVMVRGRAVAGDGVSAPDGWGGFLVRTGQTTTRAKAQ